MNFKALLEKLWTPGIMEAERGEMMDEKHNEVEHKAVLQDGSVALPTEVAIFGMG